MFYNIIKNIIKYIVIIFTIVVGFCLAFIVQHHCLAFNNVRIQKQMIIMIMFHYRMAYSHLLSEKAS